MNNINNENIISNLKRKKGITLVALVITIVVMIILAGVTIIELTGNGLFSKTQLAKEKQDAAKEDENNKLLNYESIIEQYVSSSREVGEMTTEELTNLIKAVIKSETENTSTDDGVPAGTVISYMADDAPSGYLDCNGQAVSRTEYSKLFSAIGTKYGEGDGETTFNLPDLRGEFLRGTGTNSHENSGNGSSVGVHQAATSVPFINSSSKGSGLYLGYISTSEYAVWRSMDTALKATGTYYSQSITSTLTTTTDSRYISATVRPTNTSVLYCIKY